MVRFKIKLRLFKDVSILLIYIHGLSDGQCILKITNKETGKYGNMD